MTWHFDNHGDENVDANGVMKAVTREFSPENVEGSDEVKGVLTSQMNNNGTAVNGEFSPEKGMLTWLMDDNNGGVTTAVNGDGYSTVNVNHGTKGMTWQLPATEVNGDGEMKKSMLTWQMNNDGGLTTVNGDGCTPVNVNDCTKGMLTWQLPETEFNRDGEVVTDETKSMLTWQNSVEDENDLSKFLEEASWSEMMTCQNTKVKIINDPYWLPLKFQTGAAYVTINGNEELCGSSFSDSDTSYMAGISGCSGFVCGAWEGVADEARGWVEGEVEDEDEMLARFLGEGE